MKIWIDLGNSPHVPLFHKLAGELMARGHEILWTARDYAQTVGLVNDKSIPAQVIGRHGGGSIIGKSSEFIKRVYLLARWASGKKIDLVLSHNSQEPLVVARILGIKSLNMMDYEHHPGNHISFRMAKRVLVPEFFPLDRLKAFGADGEKTRRYPGIKEDIYLSDFKHDDGFRQELGRLGISQEEVLVLIRTPATEALYNRGKEYELFYKLIAYAAGKENTKILILPRKREQGEEILRRFSNSNIIIPAKPLDGANLIFNSDLVISGGGTMNREAAALGVPAYTIFMGRPAEVDYYLIGQGRLRQISSSDDIENIKFAKRADSISRAKPEVLSAVLESIDQAASGEW